MAQYFLPAQIKMTTYFSLVMVFSDIVEFKEVRMNAKHELIPLKFRLYDCYVDV